MKLCAALLFIFAVSGILHGADFSTNVVQISQSGSVKIVTPAKSKFSAETGMGVPTLTIRSPDEKFALKLTIFSDSAERSVNSTEAEIEASVRKMAGPYAKSSIEKEITFEKVKSENAFGRFARFTDAKFDKTKRSPDDFPNVAIGVIRWANEWAIFSLFTHEKEGATFRQGMAVLESIQPVQK